jgi:hypothetical protein
MAGKLVKMVFPIDASLYYKQAKCILERMCMPFTFYI